jgi:predicted ATPase
MRINQIVFHNFRAFRQARKFSFMDEVSEQVRPLTVLAGSNGSGKSTLFDAIRTLTEYLLHPQKKYPFLTEIERVEGYVGIEIELYQEELDEAIFNELKVKEPIILRVGYGNREAAPPHLDDEWPFFYGRLFVRGRSGRDVNRTEMGKKENFLGVKIAEILRNKINQMREEIYKGQPYGGLLYFPSNRQLPHHSGGTIEPTPRENEWVFEYDSAARWRGSLEQLWVWQDYLDLQAQVRNAQNHPQHLNKFVNLTASILGKERQIFIKDGRALATPIWTNKKPFGVNLDQLPSGEQQVVLLFGEIARRQRPGSVLLIDEIENSLHPTLQRQVMWNLAQLAQAQNIQVIVSTHSATVLETVRPHTIINLDYPNEIFNQPVDLKTGVPYEHV